MGKSKQKLTKTFTKIGLSGLSLLLIVVVVIYFGFVATERFATEAQFVVKQSDSNEVAFAGLASFGSVSASMKDALILQEFILSREMAVALDDKLKIRTHFEVRIPD